jgi:pimeloyl-ACP methyl ester carboxylesterase
MTPVFKSDAAARDVQACYRGVLERWPVPSEQRRLPTREGETFVLVCGPQDAPPVVLLHGSQANASVWMFDAMIWSRDFRLYAVDMIGEPGLSAPSRPALTGEAYALWLDDVMAGLGLTGAALVGVSLGGWLALDYAIRRPGRVRRMALICPAGIGRQKNFLAKALPLLLLGPWGRRKMREMVFGPAPKTIPDAARPFIELMTLVGRSVRPRVEKLPVFSDAALKSLDMPILAILGGRDVLLDSEESRCRLMENAPQAEVLFLPEARHAIFGQTRTIHEFLLKDSPEAA